MISLLRIFIERINSLQNYYLQELKTIRRRVNKGLKENKFGYLIYYYFSVLVADNKNEISKDSFKQLQKYAEKHVRIVEPIENGKVVYEIINPKELKRCKFNLDIKEAEMLYKRSYDMVVIHADNTLIMLLIRFEEFISNVLRTIYDMFPQKYLDEQKITYSQIQKCDLEEIKDAILDREIETIMRDSYTKWFEVLSSHKIQLDQCELELASLKEIYARRNILVHNSGYVNDTYIKNSGNNKAKLGERIGVTEEYLRDAFNCIKTLIFAIIAQSSKLYKERERDYLEAVFNITFNELCDKNYSVTKMAYKVLMENPALSDEFKNMSMVNYWISRVEMGDSIDEELEQFDTSALGNQFKIAKLVLQKRFSEATPLLEEEIKNNVVSPLVFEWPLFIHYIESPDYSELKDKHHDLFDKAFIDTNNLNPDEIKVSGSSISEDVEESSCEEKRQKKS